ncbi:hypothetical protein HCB41_02815 [Listeria welshimeri]|nr:hypothetical protein [Listeria welshimeri]MBC1340915.1 hypothetical protein [Listeria welshimeri]MBC1346961.1 hypothetical protein [Listeria welshimeri]MBC1622662.1 hypothetical protein [Listeria welshimeri]MBC1683442.1 hypothetical protein [Listeria welshimeri]
MGSPKIDHDEAVVARLLNGLESAANGLKVKELSSSSELSNNFIPAVKQAEEEFEDMVASLKEYKVLFKNDISRIRKASEEIISNEKQVASKMTEELSKAIKSGVKAK